MKTIEFTSSLKDHLTINEHRLDVVTIFGDRYTGWITESGSVATKSRLGLGYLTRAYREYLTTKR